MAVGLGLKGHDQLHHFVTSTAWDDTPLRRLLVARADRLVGGPDAVLVIDDTALPKQGKLSVGLAPPVLRLPGQAGQLPSPRFADPRQGRGSGANRA